MERSLLRCEVNQDTDRFFKFSDNSSSWTLDFNFEQFVHKPGDFNKIVNVSVNEGHWSLKSQDKFHCLTVPYNPDAVSVGGTTAPATAGGVLGHKVQSREEKIFVKHLDLDPDKTLITATPYPKLYYVGTKQTLDPHTFLGHTQIHKLPPLGWAAPPYFKDLNDQTATFWECQIDIPPMDRDRWIDELVAKAPHMFDSVYNINGRKLLALKNVTNLSGAAFCPNMDFWFYCENHVTAQYPNYKQIWTPETGTGFTAIQIQPTPPNYVTSGRSNRQTIEGNERMAHFKFKLCDAGDPRTLAQMEYNSLLTLYNMEGLKISGIKFIFTNDSFCHVPLRFRADRMFLDVGFYVRNSTSAFKL